MHQDRQHHRVCDGLAESHFEKWVAQCRRTLTLGFAVAGRDLESAGYPSALGRFDIVCLVADQPGRFQVKRKGGSCL